MFDVDALRIGMHLRCSFRVAIEAIIEINGIALYQVLLTSTPVNQFLVVLPETHAM